MKTRSRNNSDAEIRLDVPCEPDWVPRVDQTGIGEQVKGEIVRFREPQATGANQPATSAHDAGAREALGKRRPGARHAIPAAAPGSRAADAWRIALRAGAPIALGAAAGAQSLTFPHQQYVAPNPAQALVIRDLDLDGRPDLVISEGHTVHLLLGKGQGRFAETAQQQVAITVNGLAVADFDSDGAPDVAGGLGQFLFSLVGVALFPGDGSGGLGAPTVVPMIHPLEIPRAIAAGDLNGDDHVDLATAGTNAAPGYPGWVSTLAGNGNGGFAAAASIAALEHPAAIALADLDRDGRSDLVVVNSTLGAAIPGPGSVSVFRSDGAGGFGPESVHSAGTTSWQDSVAVADFDGNAVLDLATVDTNSNEAVVLYGDGLGGFSPPQFHPTGEQPRVATLADWNLDGVLDLATADWDSDQVSLLLGNGSGGFLPYVPFHVGKRPQTIAAADLDANGTSDLVVGGAGTGSGPQTVEVYFGNGGSGFEPVPAWPVGSSPRDVAASDLNGDARPDLATANWGSDSISVLLAIGTGGFGPASDYSAGSPNQPLAVASGDVDGDGAMDVATANYATSTVAVLGGAASGVLGTPQSHAMGVHPQRVRLPDLDADGALDLVTADFGQFPNQAGSVTRRMGDGQGGYGPSSTFPTGLNSFDVTAADFDLDGQLDLATANAYSNDVSLLFGDGQGGFAPAISLAPGGGSTPVGIAAGDIDADGPPDLVTANYGNHTVRVVWGNGAGGFAMDTPAFPVGLGPCAVEIAELDGDAGRELVATSLLTDTVWIRHGGLPASSQLQESAVVAAQSSARHTAVADLDGDGWHDLVTANSQADSVSALLNATGSAQAPLAGITPYGWGTPGCVGPMGITASSAAFPGNQAFALALTNAPPLTAGLMFLSLGQDVAGSADPYGLGLTLHIDLGAAVHHAVHSDASGVGFSALPIPDNPTLAGLAIYAQGFWLEPPSTCSTSVYGLVASRGLSIAVQP